MSPYPLFIIVADPLEPPSTVQRALGYKAHASAIVLAAYRPGLPKFLKELSKLYEMHVYTMGTRAYAEKVCGVIDPKGEIFGRRILSRDESGSESTSASGGVLSARIEN